MKTESIGGTLTMIMIINKLKTYFILLNLVISIIAFNNMIYAQGCDKCNPPGTNPPPGPPPIPPGTNNGAGQGNSGTDNSGQGTGDNPIDDSGGPISGGGNDTGGGGIDRGGGGGSGGGGGGGNGGGGGGIGDVLSFNIGSIIQKAGFGAAIFGTIGSLAGGDNGALWGSISGTVGGIVAGLTEKSLGQLGSTILGLSVATIIFLATYKKKSQEIAEFECLPWEAPIGGEDCELCNKFKDCSEYTCKSLGQACEIENKGTKEQKCFWKNPQDVNSPVIEFKKVNKDHKFKPDPAIRPPDTGVKITLTNANCLKAYTPLEFEFITDEPSQCKIDYNLTKGKEGYETMSFFVGGNNLYTYNHSEKLSLPGPDAINAEAPELKNNGEYKLFIRCKDANGNINENSFSVSFCVDKGPDTTPPIIEGASIPSGKPVQFNKSNLYLEIYVNEPSECKWSKTDRAFKNMENKMECDMHVWEMNSNYVYTCRTNLTGIESRKDNSYYFRCKDKPWAQEGDRNENRESYQYIVVGTQPLNIMYVGPAGKISGATDYIPVYLNVLTDNGYKDGESLCYYYQGKPINDEDYILFLETGQSNHTQRQDLAKGNYTYYYKCVDLGGNAEYNKTNFIVESDKQSPVITRVYKDSGELKIMTSEPADCSYSNKDCNFEIDSGIKMSSIDYISHSSEWSINTNLYIRCKDKYDNQPNPNVCSIIVRPTKSDSKSDVIEF
ncbi:MAG: hypothetical protein Q8N99_07980 [Nanoarchaeota archaeon]|nr:hypothetical protein [Nanoarchaeota archaeon]